MLAKKEAAEKAEKEKSKAAKGKGKGKGLVAPSSLHTAALQAGMARFHADGPAPGIPHAEE